MRREIVSLSVAFLLVCCGKFAAAAPLAKKADAGPPIAYAANLTANETASNASTIVVTNATTVVLTNATSVVVTNGTNILVANATGIFDTASNATTIVVTNATTVAVTNATTIVVTNSTTVVVANATTINATVTNVTIVVVTDATPTNVTATTATPTNVTATNATSTNVTATTATPTNVTATNATSTNVTATTATPTNVTATNATSTNITATTATPTNVTATNATSTNVTATNATATNATAKAAYNLASTSTDAAAATAAAACTAKISVMNYNTRQLPKFFLFNDWDQDERLKRLPDTMRRAEYQADILILDEMMTQDAFEKVQGLKDVYPYITSVVGKDCSGKDMTSLTGPCSKLLPRSGVLALSKIPIIETHGLIYRNAAAGTWDAKANKGAIYVKVRVNGLNVHVVGTHIQADEGKVDGGPARILQMEELRHWISSFAIPNDEPIVLAGDINSPLGTPEQHTIFDHNFVFNFQPPEFGTFSASTNWLTRADAYHSKTSLYDELYLDYVATWANHLQPNKPAFMTVIKLKATEKWYWNFLEGWWVLHKGPFHHDGYYNDVSDHYPVVADFEFAVSGCEARMQEDNRLPESEVDTSFKWTDEGYILEPNLER